jgi:hypothetical protein
MHHNKMPHPNIRITYIQPYNFQSILGVIIEGYAKVLQIILIFCFSFVLYKEINRC